MLFRSFCDEHRPSKDVPILTMVGAHRNNVLAGILAGASTLDAFTDLVEALGGAREENTCQLEQHKHKGVIASDALFDFGTQSKFQRGKEFLDRGGIVVTVIVIPIFDQWLT